MRCIWLPLTIQIVSPRCMTGAPLSSTFDGRFEASRDDRPATNTAPAATPAAARTKAAGTTSAPQRGAGRRKRTWRRTEGTWIRGG